jgi:hypothetical protein
MSKLTLVSIGYRGRKFPFLVSAEVDSKGQARISESTLNHLLNEVGVLDGTTYTIG